MTRIVYIGAERVGLACLERLHQSDKNIVGIVTAEDMLREKIADRYVDITEHLSRKIDALRCYERELRPFPHPSSQEGVNAYAKKGGSEVGMEAPEAIITLRDLTW